jgi:very-short-patch-repair endonuclease
MNAHVEVRRLAELQYSAFAIWQAQAVGLDRRTLRRRIASGEYELRTKRVARIRGAPTTRFLDVLVGLLDAGPDAVLTPPTALAWWGVPGFSLLPVHVGQLRTGARHHRTIATVHSLRGLDADWVTAFRGAAIVRPELALYQMCGMVHPLRAERAIDSAWAMGLTSGPSMRLALTQLRRRGRNGTKVFERILDARPDNYIPPATNLESRFRFLCTRAGLPEMNRQVDVGGERWIGRVDFAAHDVPLIVEVQSERYHSALCDEIADAARIAALEAAGFTVVPIWDTAVWTDPRSVVEQVREGRRRARARRAA